jgi:hypothetical protein
MKNDLLSVIPFKIKVDIIGNDLEDIRKGLRPTIVYCFSGSVQGQWIIFSWVVLPWPVPE